MNCVIKSIEQKSPASKKPIRVGDTLQLINGKKINDVLDYKYYAYDARLTLELVDESGKKKMIKINKSEGQDLGLVFETYLMDQPRCCENNCLFCFVDQLPEGMRETLYFKDDDSRLSFLMGNYVTLTNLSDIEVQRIIDLHLSPVNISVHSTNPKIRNMMLGNKNGGKGLEILQRFAKANIIMNCQIVCCPGINDGKELKRSMEDLAQLYPSVSSVSIVPVGLTKYRSRLYPLQGFNQQLAAETINQVEAFGQICNEKFGSKIFYCADELYIKARKDLPDNEYYEDYPQLENGVGMMRLLITEFEEAVIDKTATLLEPFSIATGCAASKYLENILYTAGNKCDKIKGRVYAISNDYFGDSVDVAGLVTGGDIIAQLKGKDLGRRLLIPQNMLRHGEGVFLDNITLCEVSEKLDIPIRVVLQDGSDLAEAIFGR